MVLDCTNEKLQVTSKSIVISIAVRYRDTKKYCRVRDAGIIKNRYCNTTIVSKYHPALLHARYLVQQTKAARYWWSEVPRNRKRLLQTFWSWYWSSLTYRFSDGLLLFIFRLHRIQAVHETQPIATGVHGVCQSVRQPICHAAQLGFTVPKWLNESRCCLGWTLLGAHGTLCYLGVLIPLQTGGGHLLLNFGFSLVSPEQLKLETWHFMCL